MQRLLAEKNGVVNNTCIVRLEGGNFQWKKPCLLTTMINYNTDKIVKRIEILTHRFASWDSPSRGLYE